MTPSLRTTSISPWPYRLAVAVALTTFPLIWVGGLVTTYDAGMAVPDWPGTYGYNLFAYPWQKWFFGPFDLFVEHGHRLLGAAVGLLTLLLAAAAWKKDDRSWFRELSLLAVGLVIAQGLLGGARVLWDERIVALLHGCTGPAFFAFASAMVVCCSRKWRELDSSGAPALDKRLLHATWWMAAVTYLQLIAGALVRHVPLSATPDFFRAMVIFHLIFAGVVALQAAMLGWAVLSRRKSVGWLVAPTLVLLGLVALQIGLGGATWIAKYSWPEWAAGFRSAAGYVIAEKSLSQSLITTAHVANGSLILAVSVVLAVRCSRLYSVAAGLTTAATVTTLLRPAV
jgi:cytochrome c oxidase assembly protein subunit 15